MEYSEDCPFCMNTRFKNNKLVHLPSEACILFENNNIYVQVDISPLCRGHILIITKKHYLNFYETSDEIKNDTRKVMNSIKKYIKNYIILMLCSLNMVLLKVGMLVLV